ncbi:hypothetical protein Droror1_Dr00017654 [Drosera rotundifolia]
METLPKTTSMRNHLQHSNCDEISLQQSLLFKESLEDLKNLRTQLYSAAEYFERSYTNNEQKQIVVNALKDFAVKAIVNTIDHLGSMTYKINDLLDEKVKEVNGTEFRVSSIEQRLRTCKEYTDREVMAQQSSFIDAPGHHKRYTLPVGETLNGKSTPKPKGSNLDEDDWPLFRSAIRATIEDAPSPLVRKGRSVSPSHRPSRLPGTFSFTGPKKDSDKRAVSPLKLPLLRSGSLATRLTTPKPSKRSITPNPAIERQWRYPSAPQKSVSMLIQLDSMHAQSVSMHVPDNRNNNTKQIERYPSKSKLKTLLSRRKSKKDDKLYKYLDDY